MHYQITSDNIEMSPSMEALAKDKIQVLDNKLKLIPHEEKSVRVVLNKAPDDQFEVKIRIAVRGKEYFAEDIDFKLETALIDAIQILARKLKKDKIDFISADWKEARDVKRYGAEREIKAELEEEEDEIVEDDVDSGD